MQNFLILEDNRIEANQLKSILAELDVPKEIYIAGNVAEAEAIVAKRDIDVFLLDVNLPDGTGIAFAERLRETERHKFTWIIFITGFEKYAYNASRKAHCYSYIVKPYDHDEIIETVNDVLNKRVTNFSSRDYMKIKTGNISVRVPYSDIVYIESLNRKCYIHTVSQKHETARISLKTILDEVEDDRLIQCHRSYIVNKDYISKFDKKYRGSVLEMHTLNAEIPVGTNYIDKIQSMI